MLEPVALIGGMAALAYLIGAIPIGYLVARINGMDIRKVGSGNIGATNVYRCVGKSWGIFTFLVDFIKGYLPVAFFPMLVQSWSTDISPTYLSLAESEQALLFGCMAVVGHNWPVFLRFQGGKGMATGAGALLGFAPLVMLIGLISWLIFFLATRYVSLSSILTAIVIVVAAWLLQHEKLLVPAALTIMGVIVIWRHRSNIKRLLAGTEHRFEFGKRQ